MFYPSSCNDFVHNSCRFHVAQSIGVPADRCAPVPEVPHAVPDGTLALRGSTVNYTCAEGYLLAPPDGGLTGGVTCDGLDWVGVLPACESRSWLATSNYFPR